MREIEVSFEYDGFVSGIDGQENTFNVTFSYSPSPALVYWSMPGRLQVLPVGVWNNILKRKRDEEIH